MGREAGSETVGTVRAADDVHAAAGVIVTGVVADYMESVSSLYSVYQSTDQ